MLQDYEKRLIIQTGIGLLLNDKFNTQEARIMVAAIAFQESNFEHRTQIGGGPARGFWQFEKGGGVKGVVYCPSTRDFAKAVCKARNIPFDVDEIYIALAFDDVLAASFARLLLWSDPNPMPASMSAAWHYYESIWRPGKPRPPDWPDSWKNALKLYQ